ncbi:MAG: S1/P1 Nuclease [Bacteroidia bacterium]|nr:S1/P1 Nuclease [Bacteroidia bacterium]
MRNITVKFLIVLLSLTYTTNIKGWGFWSHKHINRMAVFTLPPEMIGFYKKHIEYITNEAVRPDKRRYAIKEEAPRHYIDIDHYGEEPFKIMPKRWKDAVEKFTEDTLQEYGILPWHLNLMMYKLTDAFKEKNAYRILKISTEFGHYMGDAHVPLHTTENYNGQFTDQKGIHGFWESRLPELYADNYDYLVGRAKYVDKPLARIWEIIHASFSALDSVLTFEKELHNSFPSDQIYSYETRGRSNIKTHSQPYSYAYHKKLSGMVERRLTASMIDLGSFWFTAWVNAGQPNLDNLSLKEESEDEKEEKKKMNLLWQAGKIFGREHSN